jgi:transposase
MGSDLTGERMFLAVDVSQEKLDLALGGPTAKRCIERQVRNDASGFKRLLEWVKERSGCGPSQLTVILEATGVYHEALATALHEAGCRVIIANPKRARDYAKGLGKLNKADKVDARALWQYVKEHGEQLHTWAPPPLEVRLLRALYGRLAAVEEDLQRELNRQQQAALSAQPVRVIESLQRSVEHLQEEQRRLKRSIEDHFDQHPGLKSQRELLQSVPAIGPVSADHLLCLLLSRGFRSARQAAAFCGLIPKIHESGTLRKPSHLTKTGDARLRAKLYMPAVVAIRHNPELAQIYDRLLRSGKCKMAAIGALMRHLVHIAFGIIKHQTPYNPTLVAGRA